MPEQPTDSLGRLLAWLRSQPGLGTAAATILPAYPDQAPDPSKGILVVQVVDERPREWLGDLVRAPSVGRQTAWVFRVEAWARSNAAALDLLGAARGALIESKASLLAEADLKYQEASRARMLPLAAPWPGWVRAAFYFQAYRDEVVGDAPAPPPPSIIDFGIGLDKPAIAGDRDVIAAARLSDQERGKPGDGLPRGSALAADPEDAKPGDAVRPEAARLHDQERGKPGDAVRPGVATLTDQERARAGGERVGGSGHLTDAERGKPGDAVRPATARLNDQERGKPGDAVRPATARLHDPQRGKPGDSQTSIAFVPMTQRYSLGQGGTAVASDDYMYAPAVPNRRYSNVPDGFALSAGTPDLALTTPTPSRVDAWFLLAYELAAATQDSILLQFQLAWENIFRHANAEFYDGTAGVQGAIPQWTRSDRPDNTFYITANGSPGCGSLSFTSTLSAGLIRIKNTPTVPVTLPASACSAAHLRVAHIREATDTAGDTSLRLMCKNAAHPDTEIAAITFTPATVWGETLGATIAAAINNHLGHEVQLWLEHNPTATETLNRRMDDVRLCIRFTAGESAEVGLTTLVTINTAGEGNNRLAGEGFEASAANTSVSDVGWTEASTGLSTTQTVSSPVKSGTRSLRLAVSGVSNAICRRNFTNQPSLTPKVGGVFKWSMRRQAGGDDDDFNVLIREGTTDIANVGLRKDGAARRIYVNGVSTGLEWTVDLWYDVTLTMKPGGKWDVLVEQAGSTIYSATDAAPQNAVSVNVDRLECQALGISGTNFDAFLDDVSITPFLAGHFVQLTTTPTMDEIKRRLRLHVKHTLNGTRDGFVWVQGMGVRIVA